jgi:hypothetical protein
MAFPATVADHRRRGSLIGMIEKNIKPAAKAAGLPLDDLAAAHDTLVRLLSCTMKSPSSSTHNAAVQKVIGSCATEAPCSPFPSVCQWFLPATARH